MGYSAKEQKAYNKKYYAENKEKTTEMQSRKEACLHCGHSVCHDNIFKHMKASYCKNRRAINAENKYIFSC
jgi:hypothetical protein